MQIPALSNHARPIDAAGLQPEQLEKSTTISDEQKIVELSRQFEAVLLRQILSQAQKSVIKSDLIDDSAASGIYQDMITSQLAESISSTGSFGLAQSLRGELTRQVLHHKPEDKVEN